MAPPFAAGAGNADRGLAVHRISVHRVLTRLSVEPAAPGKPVRIREVLTEVTVTAAFVTQGEPTAVQRP